MISGYITRQISQQITYSRIVQGGKAIIIARPTCCWLAAQIIPKCIVQVLHLRLDGTPQRRRVSRNKQRRRDSLWKRYHLHNSYKSFMLISLSSVENRNLYRNFLDNWWKLVCGGKSLQLWRVAHKRCHGHPLGDVAEHVLVSIPLHLVALAKGQLMHSMLDIAIPYDWYLEMKITLGRSLCAVSSTPVSEIARAPCSRMVALAYFR